MSAPGPSGSLRRSWPLLVLLLLAVLGVNRGLWTPDEPREAEIGREMALSPGIIPTLDGHRFIEKPPLYYWVLAGAYRVSGGPSPLAARAVSVVSALGTLVLLNAWAGAATGSAAAGLTCALMLATSVQFLISSHWVLLDPLLMLTTTLAAWAAWRLLAAPVLPVLPVLPASSATCAGSAVPPRRTRTRTRLLEWVLYGALTLALWIKGPIGPALIAVGLLAYALGERPVPWRRLRPLLGCLWLGAMLAALAFAIYAAGGRAALWEWGYVNHVQRLLNPGATGHRQPLLYYAWTLPYAVLPWLPALLLAVVQALRTVRRRRAAPMNLAVPAAAAAPVPPASSAAPDVARFGAWMALAMVLLLSLSATKRETYLLPALPLLFLWIGIRSHQWWCASRACPPVAEEGSTVNGAGRQRESGTTTRVLWWAQVALLVVYALAAPAAAWVWRGAPSLPILLGWFVALAVVVVLVRHAPRVPRAGPWMLATGAIGAAVLLALAGPVLNRTKDMAPFMRALGRRVPSGQPVYALHVDETLAAEVPFYTSRPVIALRAPDPLQPAWLLIQTVSDKPGVPPSPRYRLVMSQSFGPGRSLALWHLAAAVSAR